MNKMDRAVKALNECADALDVIPLSLRKRTGLFGGALVSVENLRAEADHLRLLSEAAEQVGD